MTQIRHVHEGEWCRACVEHGRVDPTCCELACYEDPGCFCDPCRLSRLLDAAKELVRLGNQPGLDDDEWEQAFSAVEAEL